MAKKKQGFRSSCADGYVLKHVGELSFKIPKDKIMRIAHPESGVPIRVFPGDKGILVYFDGGKDVSDADANRLFPRFLERCFDNGIIVEISEACAQQCYGFLLELGYIPSIENSKEILLRAVADMAPPIKTMTDFSGKRRYRGGIPEIWKELAMKICPLFLQQFGTERFREKTKGTIPQWGIAETGEVTEFLVQHNIAPNPTNCDHLVSGAMIELLMPD